MNKNESKYFNTAIKMDMAFLELLEKKEFAYITIKEICEKAGVNRSTFYLHYENVEDLLLESVEYMNEQFLLYMKCDAEVFMTQIRECPLNKLYLVTPEYLMPYLSYIQKHKRIFLTAITHAKTLRLDKSYNKLFQHVFVPILERYQVPSEDREYIMKFYIHGIMAVVSGWLRNDCKEDQRQIMNIIRQCIMRPSYDNEHL